MSEDLVVRDREDGDVDVVSFDKTVILSTVLLNGARRYSYIQVAGDAISICTRNVDLSYRIIDRYPSPWSGQAIRAEFVRAIFYDNDQIAKIPASRGLIFPICPKCDAGPMAIERYCAACNAHPSGQKLHISCPSCAYHDLVDCADDPEISARGRS